MPKSVLVPMIRSYQTMVLPNICDVNPSCPFPQDVKIFLVTEGPSSLIPSRLDKNADIDEALDRACNRIER